MAIVSLAITKAGNQEGNDRSDPRAGFRKTAAKSFGQYRFLIDIKMKRYGDAGRYGEKSLARGASADGDKAPVSDLA